MFTYSTKGTCSRQILFDVDENNKIIYGHEEVNKPYFDVIKPLMKKLYNALIDDIENKNYSSPVFKHHLNDTILGNYYRDKKSRAIIVDSNDIVTDFIASMTDDYFIDICRHLHIDDDILGELKYHEYF